MSDLGWMVPYYLKTKHGACHHPGGNRGAGKFLGLPSLLYWAIYWVGPSFLCHMPHPCVKCRIQVGKAFVDIQ